MPTLISTRHSKGTELLLKSVPLSNDTVAKKIQQMSEDIKSVEGKMLECKKFARQLVETEDVAGIPQLMVYARYKYDDINEEFLFFDQLQATTSSEDIFSGC